MTVPLCFHHHRMVHDPDKDAPRDITTGALVKAGHSRSREEGVWIGRPPYGYSVRRDGQLEEVPAEMAVVRVAALAWDHGWRAGQIASALNRWGARQRRGRGWDASRVSKLIKRHRPRPTAKDPTPAPPPPVVDQRFLPGQKTLPIFEAL